MHLRPRQRTLSGLTDEAIDPGRRHERARHGTPRRQRVIFETRRGGVRKLLGPAGLELVSRTRRLAVSRQGVGVRERIVARPLPRPGPELTVSVVCPCRNEQGNIRQIVERLPALGAATELIFVEDGSTDDTRAEIVRQMARHPARDIRLLVNPSRGKAAGVRTGFAAAKHDVLMVLDGDVSVLPEELPGFYRALADNRGELINGSRLVRPMERGAMRPLNRLSNHAFARFFSAITGQRVTDTLCGTKALRRRDYEVLAENRSLFGSLDPFGDFDLLFGAAHRHLKIVDVPVSYRARTYGRTNIHRFRDGLRLLLMSLVAVWRFRLNGARARSGSGMPAAARAAPAPARGAVAGGRASGDKGAGP